LDSGLELDRGKIRVDRTGDRLGINFPHLFS
jgi:hypothetical protein